MDDIRFGDIFFADIRGVGHEQTGGRAVIITQNNTGNRYSPNVEIIPLSAKTNKARHLPTHVVIKADGTTGLRVDSLALAEQPKVIGKDLLLWRVGQLHHKDLVELGKARAVQCPYPTE